MSALILFSVSVFIGVFNRNFEPYDSTLLFWILYSDIMERPFASNAPSGIPRNCGENPADGYPLCSLPSTVYLSSSSEPGMPVMDPGLSNSMESSSTLADPVLPMNYDPIWSSQNIARGSTNSENLDDLFFIGSWANANPFNTPPMYPTASGHSSEQPGAYKDTAQQETPYTCCHKCKRQYDTAYPYLFLGWYLTLLLGVKKGSSSASGKAARTQDHLLENQCCCATSRRSIFPRVLLSVQLKNVRNHSIEKIIFMTIFGGFIGIRFMFMLSELNQVWAPPLLWIMC